MCLWCRKCWLERQKNSDVCPALLQKKYIYFFKRVASASSHKKTPKEKTGYFKLLETVTQVHIYTPLTYKYSIFKCLAVKHFTSSQSFFFMSLQKNEMPSYTTL